MKNIFALISVFLLSVTSVFWYTATYKDEAILNLVYKKLDVIWKSNPNKLEILYKKLDKLNLKVKWNDRKIYILDKLKEHLFNVLLEQEEQNYKVIKVVDWDTVKLTYLWKDFNIRLIWIDSPESYLTRFWYKECYWEEAKNYLKELIEWKNIKIEFDETQWRKDRYKRLLWYIIYNWENINNKLITEWYAWEYKYNKKYKYINKFKESEKKANELNKWLWSDSTCWWKRIKAKQYINIDELNNKYSCWTKKYCNQISSCKEALFFLQICWLKRLDADSDWIPCESICK